LRELLLLLSVEIYLKVCATLKPDAVGFKNPLIFKFESLVLRCIVFSISIFSITVNKAFNDNELVVNKPCTGKAFYKIKTTG
jgi:hypothetical protein